jgi:RNA polymerase sigma-70 factor (ECF subfamily)
LKEDAAVTDPIPEPPPSAASDAALAQRIAAGDNAAFEALMRRCNRTLFRVARSILRNDSEAEDAVQEAYVIAYLRLRDFRADSSLATWLTRVTINEALGRLRKGKRESVVVPFSRDAVEGMDLEPAAGERPDSPEDATLRSEMRALIERKIDELPIAFRTVFVMRELEEMSVDETAEALAIPAATVRTRHFRAKALLREALAHEADLALSDAFAFAGARCDRIVAAVLARVAA